MRLREIVSFPQSETVQTESFQVLPDNAVAPLRIPIDNPGGLEHVAGIPQAETIGPRCQAQV